MRVHIEFCCVVVALVSGCLSETLIDNYDAMKVASGNGGAPGTLTGVGGVFLAPPGGYVPPLSGLIPPTFVRATGGGGFGAASTGGGSFGGVAGASGGGSSGGVAGVPPAMGAVPILHAVPNGRHSLSRYLAYEVAGVSGYGIRIGVTAADHLVAMAAVWGLATGLATGASLGGLGGAQSPALLEVLPSGDPLRYVAFPGASMPDGFAIALDGGIALAGRLDQDVSYGGLSIGRMEYGYYVAALDSDWVQTAGQGYATQAEASVHALALGADGGIHLAISEGSSYVLGFDTAGQSRYRWDITARPAAIAVDTIGRVHAVGTLDGDGWFASYEGASGDVSIARRFGGVSADLATAVVAAPNGHLRVAGSVSGKADLFGTALTGTSLGTPFLCNCDERGQVTWITLLGDAGTVATALQRGDRTYVAGHLYGPNANSPWTGSRLYAAEIEPDGKAISMFAIESSGESATDLAVDSLGNIWLSGRADVIPSMGGAATDSIVLLQLLRNSDAAPTTR